MRTKRTIGTIIRPDEPFHTVHDVGVPARPAIYDPFCGFRLVKFRSAQHIAGFHTISSEIRSLEIADNDEEWRLESILDTRRVSECLRAILV